MSRPRLRLCSDDQLLCQVTYPPVLFSVNYDRCHFVKGGIVS